MAHGRTELGRYEARLLLWLLRESGHRPDVPVRTAAFGLEQNKPPLGVSAVIAALADRGLVDVHRWPEHTPADTSLRPEGHRRALRLERERRDPEARQVYAENAVLRWAFEHRGDEALLLRDFFVADHVFFHGDALRAGEVLAAARSLRAAGLLGLTGDGIDGDVVTGRAELTERGLDCGHAGTGLAEFLRQERERQSTYRIDTIQGPVTFISNSTVTYVGTLADELAGLGPGLGLDEERLRHLLRQGDELRRAAEEGRPGRLRALVDRIREELTSAPDTTGRQLLLDMARQVGGMLG
ncbi:hypothetical protein DMB38_29355 [Streptomyces sp. WAC 06738]|uniref:hypothetical protein n=1 Tax=Streptomyces sp. WAC 06738 TaxID=2203210 RepID=UPI000F704DA2|nr:hypothetical protein [Streptomyces sp. WAC 06738]AZM49349.1 hypothetical protein DMB38_29355 [Streptomyces sp. WAC 06738]